MFLHRCGDGGGDFAQVANTGGDADDGLDRFLRRLLDVGDLGGDFIGRPGGLVGQILDFGGHHGKALAGGSPARAASMVAFKARRLVC